jgi:acyl-coenzyme A synthetase/AMP-(fatty) acid ligase
VVPEAAPGRGEPLDPGALLAHCRTYLAPFKVPAEIRLVDDLPRNALGKLQKHRLA